MNSLFGGLYCAVGDTEAGGCKKKKGGRRVGTRARVQSTLRPKMRWIIECGINTANDLGSPPTPPSLLKKKEKPERREWEKSGERRAKRKRVGGGVRGRKREKIPATLWGEKLLLKSY